MGTIISQRTDVWKEAKAEAAREQERCRRAAGERTARRYGGIREFPGRIVHEDPRLDKILAAQWAWAHDDTHAGSFSSWRDKYV